MSVISEYFLLCEILDDQVEIVAKIIQSHHKPKTQLAKIRMNLENLKVAQYSTTITMLLDKPIQYLKAHQTINKGLI